MYSTYITNDVWTIINVSTIPYWYSKKSSKILWSQTRNSGAKHNAVYILWVQIVFTILYTYLKKHDKIQHVLPAWHGLRTGLIWTVNKYGGFNKRKSSEIKQKLKGAPFLRLPRISKLFFLTTKMRQNPFGSPPFLPFFRPPYARLYA